VIFNDRPCENTHLHVLEALDIVVKDKLPNGQDQPVQRRALVVARGNFI
jgi:hypothetical protein